MVEVFNLMDFWTLVMPNALANEVEQHRAAVTRYIRYLVRNTAEAEDLAQETFLRAHRQQATLRDTAALESWLYQIASHVCIDRLRQRARAVRREVDTPVEELPPRCGQAFAVQNRSAS